MTRRPTDETVQRRGFAPSARRRNRIAAGVALAAIAVAGNFLVYSALESAEPWSDPPSPTYQGAVPQLWPVGVPSR